MEMPLLKALYEDDFGHELQKMSSFCSSDRHKFKLGSQLKILNHIVDEKSGAWGLGMCQLDPFLPSYFKKN